jgi:hypothetical protein
MGLIKGLTAGSISFSLEFHRLLLAKRRFCPNKSRFTVVTVTAAFTVILAASSWEQAGVPLARIKDIRRINQRRRRSGGYRLAAVSA